MHVMGVTMPHRQKRKNTQNITVRLDRDTIRRARILAARRDTSISGLLAKQIAALAEEEQTYQRAKRLALKLLEQGFHMGGGKLPKRSELYDR